MQEEVFGPILPFVTMESAEDAIRFINARYLPIQFKLQDSYYTSNWRKILGWTAFKFSVFIIMTNIHAARPRPLCLYVFSEVESLQTRMRNLIPSGTAVMNDTIIQFASN